MTRSAAAVLAVSLGTLGTVTALAVPAQAAPTTPQPAAVTAPATDFPVGKPKQIVNRVQSKLCLTFAVTPSGIPTAVMLKCASGKKGKIQQWTYTAEGQLMVSLSKGVGGALPNGACLDTGADLTTVPAQAPLLVLPCRAGDGQKWDYNKETGALINKANGKALSSMIGVGKQAKPTSTVPYTGGKDQKWRPSEIPNTSPLQAIAELINALLEALGLEMPDEYDTQGKALLKAVGDQVPVPDQLKQLPKQMVKMAG